MPTAPNRVAANQANARRSTGPKTPAGKARSSQNARKLPFNPNPFAIVRIEDRARIASLVADAVATYQPVNSQERLAVERIALAQHAMLRMYTLEAGFFTNCLDTAMAGPADPFILNQSELGGADIALEQHRAYWLAFGFKRYTQQSNVAAAFLRFQAQAERLHRRAVEDFHRLFKLRGQLPPEKYEENEPNPDPIPDLQPDENSTGPNSAPAAQPPNEPNPEPSSAPASAPDPEPRPAAQRPRRAPVPRKRPTEPRAAVIEPGGGRQPAWNPHRDSAPQASSPHRVAPESVKTVAEYPLGASRRRARSRSAGHPSGNPDAQPRLSW
jgi:hypothetical protein